MPRFAEVPSYVVPPAELIAPPGVAAPANTPVNPGMQKIAFDCLGLLYETRMIGNGKVLYCPGFPDTSTFSAAQFSNPSFMSTDSIAEVRDSMLFNPEVVNPGPYPPYNPSCLFPKTSSIIAGRLFGTDCFQTLVNSSLPGGMMMMMLAIHCYSQCSKARNNDSIHRHVILASIYWTVALNNLSGIICPVSEPAGRTTVAVSIPCSRPALQRLMDPPVPALPRSA
jgi:hypothetical protein